MWSGPRNISTALMRSWGNRPDTVVCDEPLYAHYLKETGSLHPIREKVIASQETVWRVVAEELTAAPLPEGKTVYYQKHMTHHFLPCIEKDWLEGVANCFLIREPREMLSSLLRILPEPGLADTGLPQQLALFDWARTHAGTVPPVLDAKDVLDNPKGMLEAFCAALGLPFTEAMLTWPPGPRDTDGVWGPHWYEAVYETTTFLPYKPKPGALPPKLTGLLDECNAIYKKLYPHRLTC